MSFLTDIQQQNTDGSAVVILQGHVLMQSIMVDLAAKTFSLGEFNRKWKWPKLPHPTLFAFLLWNLSHLPVSSLAGIFCVAFVMNHKLPF